MDFDLNQFNKIKDEVEENYKPVGEVYCPYLKEKVSFNAKGLDHIKFKEWNKPRLISEQYLRLKLLRLAPKIIEKSHTLQEYNGESRFERQKINSRWERRMIEVEYYGFIAIINNLRIKIIIKKIIGGKPFFYSIIPFWKQRKINIIGQTKKILCDGDLEKQ